ncbi:hypothetical protein [Erythrobacter rubeus]|uniref:Uncharacterized protein n=1 Tax=Erythrobacter rubeus TaxID=2760803 RepID=A0ABR8KU82_9SPHN|nr:hypothetical protein [Erythrobacter rubeus]MBD2841812.1 hypothetical protein [Erythrobacter rubeus]
MIWKTILIALNELSSLTIASFPALLLDYQLIGPYIYSVTYFDPSDSFDYILFAFLYAPCSMAVMCFWQRGTSL